MKSIRMNITLPVELAHEFISSVDERKRSEFIAKSLRYYMKLLKDKSLKVELIEGYQASKIDGARISKEFEHSDLEGWDEF